MKAVRVHQFGGPEVLKYETDVPIPTPGPSDVLIRVKSVGVNPIEAYIRTGEFPVKPALPAILGDDCAGIVEKTGSDVITLKPGDRVFASKTSTGSYAEFAVSPATNVYPLGDALNFNEGASLSLPYFTAYRALFHRGLAKPGETVLIHGASGGVGMATVQVARAYGMRVFGTAGTVDGLKLVEKAGANAVFNHRKEGYLEEIKQEAGDKGINLIIENAGHVNLKKDVEILATGGRVAVVGSRGPTEISVCPRDAILKEATITGVLIYNSSPTESSEALGAIQGGIANGWLHPVVGKVFPLQDASKAHTEIIAGSGALGKIVLSVD